MSKLKITVLKKTFYQDLADAYAQPDAPPCPYFTEGQEFIVEHVEKPEGFCTWARADLRHDIFRVASGGEMPGLKQPGVAIAGCTDWFRPVIFKIERIEDE